MMIKFNLKSTSSQRSFALFFPSGVLNQTRAYSEKSESSNKFKPIKSYANAYTNRKQILEENQGRSGVYRWINNLNNKTYIGSSINLSKRLGNYYNKVDLTRNPRPITQALLKHGHSNFTLEILEYCPQASLLEREQFYLNSFKPSYNILKFAYSMLGFKHSPENISKFKLKTVSPEHKEILSLAHKDKVVSEETRKKLAIATTQYKKNNPLSAEALANIKAKTTGREGVAVKVLNTETNETRDFTNQTEAGEFL